MLSKSKIQLLQSLQQKKFRRQHHLFIAEGEKIVNELLGSPFNVHSVYALGEWIDAHTGIAKRLKDNLIEVNETDLKKISALSAPNKVVAVSHIPETKIDSGKIKNELVIALDEINDPGNLGTLIRIAHWFGVSSVVCSVNTVDAYNPKTVQSAMGSLFRINIIYDDLKDWLMNYKLQTGNIVYGMLLNGDSVYGCDLKSKGVIVIGNESHGIDKNLLEVIDKKIKIPAYGSDESSAESLNAAVAAAVALGEFRRRNGI